MWEAHLLLWLAFFLFLVSKGKVNSDNPIRQMLAPFKAKCNPTHSNKVRVSIRVIEIDSVLSHRHVLLCIALPLFVFYL